jgi:predicted dehydrogenase
MDVGCYCIHLSRLVAGAEPETMTVSAQVSDAGIDEIAAGMLRFPNGIVASFTCGMTVHADNAASICGTEGYIEVPVPWKPPAQGATFALSTSVPPMMDAANKPQSAPLPRTSPKHVIAVDAPTPLFALEADDLAAVILDGAAPTISEADSLGNMAVLDTLRRQAGI